MTIHYTDRAKPMLAASYAETIGWGGIRGKRGMYCPGCREAS